MFSKSTFKSTGRTTLAMRIARLAIQRFWDDPEADWLYYFGEIEPDGEKGLVITINGSIHVPKWMDPSPMREDRLSPTVEVRLELDEWGRWKTKSANVMMSINNSGQFWCGEYPPGDPQTHPLLPVYTSTSSAKT